MIKLTRRWRMEVRIAWSWWMQQVNWIPCPVILQITYQISLFPCQTYPLCYPGPFPTGTLQVLASTVWTQAWLLVVMLTKRLRMISTLLRFQISVHLHLHVILPYITRWVYQSVVPLFFVAIGAIVLDPCPNGVRVIQHVSTSLLPHWIYSLSWTLYLNICLLAIVSVLPINAFCFVVDMSMCQIYCRQSIKHVQLIMHSCLSMPNDYIIWHE